MGDVRILTGEQIRQAARESRIERELLVVPELGGAVYVRGMSGKERDKFEEGLRIKKGKHAGQSDLRNFRAQLAVKVIVDEHGERILNDGDVDIIGKLPAGVLDRILAKCNELSGKAEEEIEDLGNASATVAGADSSSSSLSS
jgi:hypothetical protein